MKTIQFNIAINAPAERVWESLWSDAGYRHWTEAFQQGSHAETDWQEGGPVRFLGPDGSGMYSTIESAKRPTEMIFLHHGEVRNGVAQPPAPWAGARERYFLHEENGGTRVEVVLDGNDEMAAYFLSTFPVALERLKHWAEGAAVS